LGDCKVYKIGFEYRAANSRSGNNEKWTSSGFYAISSTGNYEIELEKDKNSILSGAYEYRVVLIQDGLRTPGLSLRARGEFVSPE
jgi:hypothetical protein